MKRNAFTLVELLVSIAIISVLIAVLLPALAGARRQGARVACQSNLRQMVQAIWAYSVANDARVPYIESPITNGGSVDGYGNPSSTDADTDPYNRELWPFSLQNVLMPLYLGGDEKIFICPAAKRGWPRDGSSVRMSYRDAGINQPNGLPTPAGSYLRESFGFLDGRPMNELRIHFTGDPIQDAQLIGQSRGMAVRDIVERRMNQIFGPHGGGVNLINREFGVEFRDRQTVQDDLGTYGGGVMF